MPANSTDHASLTGEPSVRIPVDLRRFPWTRRLATDYAFDFPAVAPFFAGDPTDRDAWVDAIARTRRHERRRDAIAAVIAAQQQRRGAPAAAMEAARRLADPRTVAIATGQQAGLFGGPMFTLLKALTALKLAEQASRLHDVPVVALFWIDAEDHDWNEVRTCTVFDEALAPRAIELPPAPGDDPQPIASVRLDPSVEEALRQLEAALPATEFREAIVSDLRAAYTPGTGMAEAFGRWLERTLGGRGLVVYDASDPAAKPLAAGVFERELSSPGATSRLASAAGSDLTTRGYHAQVQLADESLALFHLDGGRRPIRRDQNGFAAGDRTFAAAELVRLAAEQPEGFSPNVLLRPVVQDAIFPTVCYVAGPNELAYLAQLRGVYEQFGVPMPLMYPRATATVLDSAALRFLTRYDVPFEALQAQDESALNALLERQIPAGVDAAFTGVSAAVEAGMARLVAEIPAIDPTLEGAARSTLGRMQHDLQTLHGKMIQAAKRRDDTLRRQFTRTRALAFPNGHGQEREIGFVWFLNQYGPALIDRLHEELPLELGHHWIVAI